MCAGSAPGTPVNAAGRVVAFAPGVAEVEDAGDDGDGVTIVVDGSVGRVRYQPAPTATRPRGLRLPAAVAGQPQPATVVAGEGSQHTQEAEEGA